MKNIVQTLVVLAAIGFWISTSAGCGSKDDQYRPAKGQEPKAPVTQGRTGDSKSFLPSRDPGATTEDENIFGEGN